MYSKGQKSMSVYCFLSQLFIRLNEKMITYCILRNYEGLPEEVGNDIDIWIKDRDQEKFQKILFEIAKETDWEIILYSPRFSYYRNYFFAKQSKRLNILHIDCWTFLYWKSISYIDESVFHKHRLFHEKGFYILSPGVEASVSLLGNLIYHKKVKDKYKKLIIEYANKDSESLLGVLKRPFGEKISKFIVDKAKAGKWDTLEKKAFFTRYILIRRAFFYKFFRQIKIWVVYFFERLTFFFFTNSGLFIVLIGPDGSGKSTTARNLLESDIQKLFQKKMYFHGHFSYLPELKRIVSLFYERKKKTTASADETGCDSLKPFGILRAIIYPLYYGLNYFVGHILIWKERVRGGLVVFDRYFYDYLIQKQFSKCPRWVIYLIAHLIPRPDVLIYLKNDPEIIRAYKQELSIEEIKRQSKICETITNHFKNGIVIETSCSLREVGERVQKVIINKIKEKHRLKI